MNKKFLYCFWSIYRNTIINLEKNGSWKNFLLWIRLWSKIFWLRSHKTVMKIRTLERHYFFLVPLKKKRDRCAQHLTENIKTSHKYFIGGILYNWHTIFMKKKTVFNIFYALLQNINHKLNMRVFVEKKNKFHKKKK